MGAQAILPSDRSGQRLSNALEYEVGLALSRFPLPRASPGWVCRSPVWPACERTESLPQKGFRTSLLLSLESQGGEEGKTSISRCRLEATANKQPAHAFTVHTLVIVVVTCSFARWAFGPIFLTDRALIYSRASMRARHASAFPIGQDNVMARRSTACANCDWFRALHAVGQCILPTQQGGSGISPFRVTKQTTKLRPPRKTTRRFRE